MLLNSGYNASFAFYTLRWDAGDALSPLIAAMERSMTFRLGERGLVEENIPIGCSLHPNFNANCQQCREIFKERRRIRPFYLKFPQTGDETYQLIIPLGLVPFLLEKGYPIPLPIKEHMSAIVEDMEEKKRHAVVDPEVTNVPPEVRLSPQHREAIKDALTLWRGIIRGIPGAGKTWVAIGLLSCLSSTLRVCWLTHTQALLNQTAGRLRMVFNEPIGIIGEGVINVRERITVAMFQSLHSRIKEKDPAILEFLPTVDVLIIDEFHHTAATTFFKVAQAFKKAYLRWGLSATPYREIRKENFFLVGAMSHKVVSIKIAPLPIKLIVYEMAGSVKLPPTIQDGAAAYQRQYEIAIVRNPIRNLIIANEAISHPPAVILVQRIIHGAILKSTIEREIKRRGKEMKVAFIYGELSGAERQRILSEYEKGEIDILILSDVGKEGLSLKRIRTLINAAGQKSRVALVQRVGRGLHPKGKEEVRVVEFKDAGGIPRQHSLKRLKALEEEFVIQEKTEKHWKNQVQTTLNL